MAGYGGIWLDHSDTGPVKDIQDYNKVRVAFASWLQCMPMDGYSDKH